MSGPGARPPRVSPVAALAARSEQRAVSERLRTSPTPRAIEEAVEEAAVLVERLVADLHGPAAPSVACRAGCSWCCHVRVRISPLEALTIARHVRDRLGPDELATLLERLTVLEDRTRTMSREERANTRLPCAFLVDDRCSIHEVRPVRCRGWTSYDAEACRELLHTGRGEVETDAVRWEVASAIADGLDGAPRDLDLEAGPVELTAAVRAALVDPSAAERWLAGERVLDPGRGVHR